MKKEERQFRKLFKEMYEDFRATREKDSYDFGILSAYEEIAEKVFLIDYEKLEKRLDKGIEISKFY